LGPDKDLGPDQKLGWGWIITTLMPTMALTLGSYNRAECGNIDGTLHYETILTNKQHKLYRLVLAKLALTQNTHVALPSSHLLSLFVFIPEAPAPVS